MSGLADGVEVALAQDVVLVRVVGLGRLTNALLFEEFCADMIERGYKFFIIDLAQCRGMDSTFMGILVGLTQTGMESGQARVCLINGNDYCHSLIHNLGLERIVRIVDKEIRLPKVQTQRLEEVSCSDEERLDIVRRAHENLTRLDTKNEKLLAPFVEALRQEVAAKHSKKGAIPRP